MKKQNRIKKIYEFLIDSYGPQGWWPLISHPGSNPTKSGCIHGYHPGDHSFPKTPEQQFEICLGAILTQNTSWVAVEKALHNLKRSNALDMEGIKKLSDGKLKECIRPAGYFNQKAAYIREFTNFFEGCKGRVQRKIKDFSNTSLYQAPSRKDLLSVRGIGPETADSILLYAFNVPTFVVDAYTRRILLNLRMIKEDASYDCIKRLFEENLEKDVTAYQEYHALLVEHAKRYYLKKEDCRNCPLLRIR